ncbi:MAG: LysE family translocator [Novosphingobium sp.]
MISLPLLLAWAGLALAATISPGPDTLLVLGHSARGGRRAGLLAVAGVITGGLWYILLCGFGALSVLTSSPTLFAIVKFAGAAYLAWLGFGLLRGALRPSAGEKTQQISLADHPFRQGLLTNALNPKLALFYLAVLPQFTGNSAQAPLIGMALIAIHFAMGAIWLSALAIATGRARHWVGGTGAKRWLEGALGAGFIALGGKLALTRS